MKMRMIISMLLLTGWMPIQGESDHFSLRLIEYELGLPGQIFDIVSDSKRTIIRKAHPKDGKWTVIFEEEREKKELIHLSQILRSVDISSLENEYINQGVFDGYEVIFEIDLGEGPKKVIDVSNCYNPFFNEIINAVNKIYGDKKEISPFPFPSEESGTISVELTANAEQTSSLNSEKAPPPLH